MSEKTSKVAHEVAVDEFSRMCEVFDLEMPSADATDLSAMIAKILIGKIEEGRVTVAENGLPTVHLKYPVGEISTVTFQIPKGASIVALGDKRSQNDTTNSYKVMSDLTGQPVTLFSKMNLRPDLTTVQLFRQLFLAS